MKDIKLQILLDSEYVIKFWNITELKTTNISINSKIVQENGIFFALKGDTFDGNKFILDAISKGAIVIVSEMDFYSAKQLLLKDKTEECIKNNVLENFDKIAFIQVNDIQKTLSYFVPIYFDNPQNKLKMIGITGTKGKTTTSFIVQYLLNAFGIKSGLIGTIHNDIGSEIIKSTLTTPNIIEFYNYLSKMSENRCLAAVFEASSHSLKQNRIGYCQLHSAIFTNLASEHMDYHKDMDDYFESKSKLFEQTYHNPSFCIINSYDSYGQKLINRLQSNNSFENNSRELITFGLFENNDKPSQVEKSAKYFTFFAKILSISTKGTKFLLKSSISKTYEEIFEIPLIGKHNVLNLLAGLCSCYAFLKSDGQTIDFMLRKLREILMNIPDVPGRLQKIDSGQSFDVFVDFAHTEDSLLNVLSALKPLTKGNLIVVFGCGGNRDKTKRGPMTRVVQEFSDFAFATADNPRNENIFSIFEDMKVGLSERTKDKVSWVPDREDAIHSALKIAKNDDCVIITGKGPEEYQEINNQKFPFNDELVIRKFLSAKKN